MGQARKKSHEKKAMNTEVEDDPHQALAVLGEALIEDLQEKDEESIDVFDLYSHALKAKIYLRENNFCPRLIKGYNALLDTLKK